MEKRAAREVAEYNKNNCPMPVMEGVVNDSMTFDEATRTIHYYYTLSGILDTTALDTKNIRHDVIESVKNNTGLKKYKENKFNFAYTYFSTKNKGKVLLDVKVTPEQYK
ncbi:MAG: hypothetical protein LUC88_06755 [Prevotella sp.]|nr:hypothetical protein [Prevotella sp.]